MSARVGAAIVGTVCLCVGAIAPAAAKASPAFINWPAYLHGATHPSTSPARAISTADAASLTQAWSFLPGAPPVASLGETINSSPTVYDGVVYVGANNGSFYALNEKTGAILWQTSLGYVSYASCGTRGITSTATVAVDTATGQPTVYVSGGSGYLYALDAATGAVTWKALIAKPGSGESTYYDWSSPTVSGNHIYVGLAGSCTDHIRGGLLEFDQSTGKRLHAYYTVPSGVVGGSVWASAAVAADGDVFFGTGNDISPTSPNEGTSESVVELDGQDLDQLGVWQLPLSDQPSDDDDFGASVSLFGATLPGTTGTTPLVGVCNKNGVFYTLRQADLAAGPVWQTRIAAVNTGDNGMSAACLASAVPDGKHLYVAATATTIGGTSFAGSIRELNAATGKIVWSAGLPAQVLGTPSLDAAGVISVATMGSGSEPSADYLIDAATGAVLATVDNGDSPEFAQPVFADGYVFLATQSEGLFAYGAPG